MKNLEVAELLNKIADYLELKEETFKVRAYRKAALTVEGLSEDITEVWKNKRLEDLPGIGEGITKKISDFLQNGKSKYLEELKKQTPVDMEGLGSVEGIGPKTILKLYKKLNIKTVKELEQAAKKGKIRNIEGLGEVVEKNILKSIDFSKLSKGRILLGHAIPTAEEIISKLKRLKEVTQADICGSVGRGKETIGDLDILVSSSKPEIVMDFFTKLPNVKQVLARGKTKSSVRLDEGIQVDLRVVNDNIYGAALNYFIGSKQHNIALRNIAIKKGFKLSEYGLFEKKSNKLIAGKIEEEIYKKLGMQFIPPEIREDEGEIEIAQKNRIPKLINFSDIKGDLQMHSVWSDGSNTIEGMAIAAKKLGYEYIAMTDHGGKLMIAHALDEKRFLMQFNEIDKVSKKLEFHVLKGAEVDINSEGNIDLKNSILKKFDVVVASLHSGIKNPKLKVTNRVVKAMENEHVDIIGHPTGRLIGRREGADFDIDVILDKAKETGTVLEINSYPDRLDLRDTHVRKAVKKGVKLAISTDAHDTWHLKFMRYGVITARRGWATKEDIINTRSLKDMMRMLRE